MLTLVLPIDKDGGSGSAVSPLSGQVDSSLLDFLKSQYPQENVQLSRSPLVRPVPVAMFAPTAETTTSTDDSIDGSNPSNNDPTRSAALTRPSRQKKRDLQPSSNPSSKDLRNKRLKKTPSFNHPHTLLEKEKARKVPVAAAWKRPSSPNPTDSTPYTPIPIISLSISPGLITLHHSSHLQTTFTPRDILSITYHIASSSDFMETTRLQINTLSSSTATHSHLLYITSCFELYWLDAFFPGERDVDDLVTEMDMADMDGVEALAVQWMLSGGSSGCSYIDGGRAGGVGGGGRRSSDRVMTGHSRPTTAKKAQGGKSTVKKKWDGSLVVSERKKNDSKVVDVEADSHPPDVPITYTTNEPLLLPQVDNMLSSCLPTHSRLNENPHLATRLFFLQQMCQTWSSTISNLTTQMHLVSTQCQDDILGMDMDMDMDAVNKEVQAAMLDFKGLEVLGRGFGESIGKAAERIKLVLASACKAGDDFPNQ